MKKTIFLAILAGLIMISGCISIECTQKNYCSQNQCIIKNPADTEGICKPAKENDLILCPEAKEEFCIQSYAPVCGNDRNTYSNSCIACQKITAYQRGECIAEEM